MVDVRGRVSDITKLAATDSVSLFSTYFSGETLIEDSELLSERVMHTAENGGRRPIRSLSVISSLIGL